MCVATRIREKLEAALDVNHLEVVDESHLHAGHAGARPEGETHFRVILVSENFRDLSRLERQRRVNDLLKTELDGPVHALVLKLSAP